MKHKGKKMIVIVLSAVGILFFTVFLTIHLYIQELNRPAVTKALVKAAVEEKTASDQTLAEEGEEKTSSGDAAAISADEAIRKNMKEKSTDIPSDKEVFHILLVGTDNREEGERGRSDAMILLSFSKKKKQITAVSFLRDIYLAIPEYGNNRLNAACAYGGEELLMKTINSNFKLSVNRYASIDFSAFMEVIDALGGVELAVTEEEIPVMNQYIVELNQGLKLPEETDILTKAGVLLLNGKQTLSYARNRYTGTDFMRTSRQRTVLEKVFHKVKEKNLLELNSLLQFLLKRVTTNLTEGEIFSLLLSLPEYAGYDISQLRIPADNSYTFERIRGMEVITLDFETNINCLIEKLYGEETP